MSWFFFCAYLRQQLYADKQWHMVTESHLIIPDSFAAAAAADDHDDYDDVSVSDDGVTVVSVDVDGHVH